LIILPRANVARTTPIRNLAEPAATSLIRLLLNNAPTWRLA